MWMWTPACLSCLSGSISQETLKGLAMVKHYLLSETFTESRIFLRRIFCSQMLCQIALWRSFLRQGTSMHYHNNKTWTGSEEHKFRILAFSNCFSDLKDKMHMYVFLDILGWKAVTVCVPCFVIAPLCGLCASRWLQYDELLGWQADFSSVTACTFSSYDFPGCGFSSSQKIHHTKDKFQNNKI